MDRYGGRQAQDKDYCGAQDAKDCRPYANTLKQKFAHRTPPLFSRLQILNPVTLHVMAFAPGTRKILAVHQPMFAAVSCQSVLGVFCHDVVAMVRAFLHEADAE